METPQKTKLTRQQVMALASFLDEHQSVNEITIMVDGRDAIHFYHVELIEKLKPIRMTPKLNKQGEPW